MKVILNSLCTVSFALSLIACSGGRQPISRGGHCFNRSGANYEPIPLEEKNANFKKMEFIAAEKDGEVSALTEGKYEYYEAEFFYNEHLPDKENPNKYRRIHVKHARINNENKFGNVCTSYMPVNDNIDKMVVNAVTDFEVTTNKEIITAALGQYQVSFENPYLRHSFEKNNKGALESPKDFYEKPELAYQLYKLENSQTYSHELRSKSALGKGEVSLVIRYKFVKPEEKEDDGLQEPTP